MDGVADGFHGRIGQAFAPCRQREREMDVDFARQQADKLRVPAGHERRQDRFERALNSVSRYAGTKVVKVPAAFTSQRCSACRHVDPKSRDSQAVFRCIHCARLPEHADVKAAKNILAAGRALGLNADSLNACGDDP
jgi:transposase